MSGVIHHSEISDTVKRMHKVVINQAVHELVTAKLTGAKEKDMRKSYTKFMATFETMGAKITRPALHTRVCREYQKKLRLTMPVEEVEMEDTSNDVSSISSPDVSNAPELEEIEEEPLQPGNTKGNTKVKRQQDAKDYVDCMNEITYDYATKLAENRITKKRCKGGYLESLIQEKKLKYEVPDTISPETIRSRVRTGNLDPSHPGTQSPLHEAEQALVVICIQMGQIRQPLSEANGKFKVEWYRAKADLMDYKFDHSMPRVLSPTDIIPLLNKIFHKSYGTEKSNLKAVADRGWYPANWKLIDHPSLVDDTVESPTVVAGVPDYTPPPSSVVASVSTQSTNAQTTSTSTVTLNINSGMAATVLDRMINERARCAGAKKAADERKAKGDEIVQNLKAAKKFTSGVMAANGVHCLNDPKFLEAYNARQTAIKEKAEKTALERRQRRLKKIDGVKKLREKYGHESIHKFAKFNKAECSTYLQYKKQSSKDPGMPKDLEPRRARCLEWMGRPSPTASPHASDDEGGDDDDDDDGMLIYDGLTGLTNNAPLLDEDDEEGEVDGHL